MRLGKETSSIGRYERKRSTVGRTGLVGRQFRAGAVAVAVLAVPSLLLAGTARAATLSATRTRAVDAAASVTYWSGFTKYPRASYEFNFTDSGSRLTYFFVAGVCKPSIASESGDNFPTSVPISHGKFVLNYIDHRASSDRSDPGFHVIIKGQINGDLAKGTVQILNDPDLDGACNGEIAHWQAHNDTATTT
jgi:hypothetical protein